MGLTAENSDSWASSVLFQSGTAESFQIVLHVNVANHRHLGGDPGQRNIWLGAAEFLQGNRAYSRLPGHSRGGGQHPVGADEIAALPDGFAGKTHGLVVVG